jgi:hypothetical protein
MPVTSAKVAPPGVPENVRIGPLVASVITPAGARGEWIRQHCRSHVATGDPEIELRLLSRDRDMDQSVAVARGEVRVGAEWGPIPRMAASWQMTPRAVARAAKWTLRPGHWQRSRRQLLVRHGLEHPLMSILDLRHAYFTLHAAAVTRDDVSLLILGANGAGKTTAALQLVEQGWQLAADNFVATDGVQAFGFPGPTRQKAGAMAPVTPSAAGGVVAGVLLCAGGLGPQRLSAERAQEALRAYVGRERDDHRDSPVLTLVSKASGKGQRTCETDVVSRLAQRPVVEWNWRTADVAAAVDALTP